MYPLSFSALFCANQNIKADKRILFYNLLFEIENNIMLRQAKRKAEKLQWLKRAYVESMTVLR